MNLGLKSIVVGYVVSNMELRSSDVNKYGLTRFMVPLYPQDMQVIDSKLSLAKVQGVSMFYYEAKFVYDKNLIVSSVAESSISEFKRKVSQILSDFLRQSSIPHTLIK